MGTARSYHTATLLDDGTVLVIGGQRAFLSGNGIQSAELFDPVSGTFALTGSPVNAEYPGHTATLLNDGTVLVIDSDGVGAELYR